MIRTSGGGESGCARRAWCKYEEGICRRGLWGVHMDGKSHTVVSIVTLIGEAGPIKQPIVAKSSAH